jgi:TolA-binding protein
VLGAFNVIFGAVPSRYQWITESLGFEGDIATGLEQLSRASRQGKLLRLESVLFASYAEKIMLNDAPAALNRLKGEKEAHGATYLLDYFLALAHLQTRQNEQAIAILNQSEQYESPGVFPLPYWNYQLGKAYYYRDQQREAQRYLARFLKAYRGNMYRTDAAFRLGVSLTLSGQYQQAKKIFAHITKGEESGFELDEYAAFMAGRFLSAKPSEAELALFRARNFYDGGYEMEAAEILGHLEKRQDLNEDETTELYYRWARLKHNQGQLVQAQQYYEKCGTTEATYQRWLQAYALYYLGEIAQSQEDWDTAKAYYQDVLGRDDYFYQAGLENRCKTRLSALEKRSDSR